MERALKHYWTLVDVLLFQIGRRHSEVGHSWMLNGADSFALHLLQGLLISTVIVLIKSVDGQVESANALVPSELRLDFDCLNR